MRIGADKAIAAPLGDLVRVMDGTWAGHKGKFGSVNAGVALVKLTGLSGMFEALAELAKVPEIRLEAG